jgi:hypothetical protein
MAFHDGAPKLQRFLLTGNASEAIFIPAQVIDLPRNNPAGQPDRGMSRIL